MKKTIIYTFRTIWELPQLLVGVICEFAYKATFSHKHKNTLVFTSPKIRGGVSLSYITILQQNNELSASHEAGHSSQSAYLGVFYLPVVGLCSVAHKLLHKCNDYYHFFTEKWADRISKIERKQQKHD